MKNLIIFDNAEFGQVRTVTINGEPYFVGKDVAAALGYEAERNAIKKHVNDEDKLTHQFSASGQNRNMTIINESGLYALIFGSKLDSAKRFKHWVTREVLPTIRKTGGYQVQSEIDHMRVLELLAACDSEKLPYALSIINAMGYTPIKSNIHADNKIPNISDFIRMTTIINRPTADVYAEYTTYCTKCNTKPVSKIIFSKIINKLIGSHTQPKKVNGTVKRCFLAGGKP